MDRETVITHLQIIHTWAEFAHERDLQFFTAKHLEDIAQWADDALALLKEQEAVVPVYTTNSHPFHIGILYRCGNCHHSLIRDEDLFCRHCGKPIDWTKKAVKLDA